MLLYVALPTFPLNAHVDSLFLFRVSANTPKCRVRYSALMGAGGGLVVNAQLPGFRPSKLPRLRTGET